MMEAFAAILDWAMDTKKTASWGSTDVVFATMIGLSLISVMISTRYITKGWGMIRKWWKGTPPYEQISYWCVLYKSKVMGDIGTLF